MLDDQNVIKQKDAHGALKVAAEEWQQTEFTAQLQNAAHDDRPLTKVVAVGMGGSALMALLAKAWQGSQLKVPFETLLGYNLPNYVDENTLVIVSSYSGNTEEALSCLDQALDKGAQIGAMAAGGKLLDLVQEKSITHVVLPGGMPQRMAMFLMLKALVTLLVDFKILPATSLDEISMAAEFLKKETAAWLPEISVDKNEAKQLALLAVGKTPVIYGGALTAPLAYKWKISWNENAKNVAFWNQYPEFNHNEFMGWASHPVDKPFVVFDLVSSFEHPRILKRFELSDKLLSGKRPKANIINLRGETPIAQLLWGCIFADFITIYVAILNGVDPTPVELIEKLKKELA